MKGRAVVGYGRPVLVTVEAAVELLRIERTKAGRLARNRSTVSSGSVSDVRYATYPDVLDAVTFVCFGLENLSLYQDLLGD